MSAFDETCSEDDNQSVWTPEPAVCEPEAWTRYTPEEAKKASGDPNGPNALDLFMTLIGGDPRRRY